jgi:predicted histone-like DNA-binding protein
MPVNYIAVPKVNPNNLSEPVKYYAQVVSNGDINLRDLATEISLISTLSIADVTAVIEILLQVIPLKLTDGKIVRLDGLGYFSLSVSSEGVNTAAELSSKNIKNANIKFRPGQFFQKAVKDVEYNKL